MIKNIGDSEDFVKIHINKKIDEIHYQDIVASLNGRYVLFSIIEKILKNIFATQFHPEKSGVSSLKVYKNFIGLV